jgi:hypothetical protein
VTGAVVGVVVDDGDVVVGMVVCGLTVEVLVEPVETEVDEVAGAVVVVGDFGGTVVMVGPCGETVPYCAGWPCVGRTSLGPTTGTPGANRAAMTTDAAPVATRPLAANTPLESEYA